jgi:hypothetical protein
VQELEERFGSRWRYTSALCQRVLRPEEAGEMGGGAGGGRGGLTSGRGGGDGPFRPVARQISQGIRQRTGSLGEYSARIDVYICISTVYI